MESMDRDDAYDWVDDDSLDFDATMRRFDALEPICVTTGPVAFGIASAVATSADYADTIRKSLLGSQRQAATFA